MVRSIFTVEQRKWLQSFAKEYDDRVKYCIFPETGSQFARNRAEEFANQWEKLSNGMPYTRKEIIKVGLSSSMRHSYSYATFPPEGG